MGFSKLLKEGQPRRITNEKKITLVRIGIAQVHKGCTGSNT